MNLEIDVKIDLKNPPPISTIEYGNPLITLKKIDLCPKHLQELIFTDPNNRNNHYFRFEPIRKIEAAKSKVCHLCQQEKKIW